LVKRLLAEVEIPHGELRLTLTVMGTKIDRTSTDCKYWTMRMVNDFLGNASKKIFFYRSHTFSTNQYNIDFIFFCIINYRFSNRIIFFNNILFYTNSFFLCQEVNLVKQITCMAVISARHVFERDIAYAIIFRLYSDLSIGINIFLLTLLLLGDQSFHPFTDSGVIYTNVIKILVQVRK
jgi:hypothetical protein